MKSNTPIQTPFIPSLAGKGASPDSKTNSNDKTTSEPKGKIESQVYPLCLTINRTSPQNPENISTNHLLISSYNNLKNNKFNNRLVPK